jgi:hypothetical protein
MHSDGPALPDESYETRSHALDEQRSRSLDRDKIRRHYERMAIEAQAEPNKTAPGQIIDTLA